MKKPEEVIEDYLIARCKAENVLCWKYTSPSLRGVPDRYLAFNGNSVFVECKAPGKKPRADQRLRMQELRKQGIRVVYVDSKESVDNILRELKSLPDLNAWGSKREEPEEGIEDVSKNNRIFKAPVRSM